MVSTARTFPATPAPVEDCYAALTWVAAKAAELGIDPARLGVGRGERGWWTPAAVALLARDRGGPALCFQLLGIPELDDRLDTQSMREYVDTPLWNRPNAIFSWTSYLGTEPGGDDVSPYAAPARATDLAGLPPTFVSTCQFDPLRDEGIEYARRLAHANVHVELRLYPGTFHGSTFVESAESSRRIIADEIEALRRGLTTSAAAGHLVGHHERGELDPVDVRSPRRGVAEGQRTGRGGQVER